MLAAGVFLCVGIAYGRPAPGGELLFANRYVPLPAPFFVGLTLGALALLGRKTRELALVLCFAAMAAATPAGIAFGRHMGNIRREHSNELDELVRGSASPDAIRAFYDAKLFHMLEHGWWPLDYFSKQRLPPFDLDGGSHAIRCVPAQFDSSRFGVESSVPPMVRWLDGEEVYCVRDGTTLMFDCKPGSRAFVAILGAPELLVDGGKFPRMRVRAVLRDRVGAEHAIGEHVLDPVRDADQRGMRSLEFHLEPGHEGTLLLRFEAIDRTEEVLARSWVILRKFSVE
jgi:hypothetical protein